MPDETKKSNFSLSQKAAGIALLILLAIAIFIYLSYISLQRNERQFRELRQQSGGQSEAAERARKMKEYELEGLKEQLKPLQAPGLAGEKSR